MKRTLLMIISIVFIFALCFAMTSCLEGLKTPNIGDTGNGGNEGGEQNQEPEPVVTENNVYYVFDDDGDGTPSRVLAQKVKSDTGFTEEQLLAKDNLLYHGYGFCGFYSDSKLKNEFDFTAPITSDTTIYCKRDTWEAGRNIKWSVSGTTLKFTGSGDMYDFVNFDDVPWRDSCRSTVDSVIIEEGITSVAASAFHSFKSIRTVNLPASITRIGNNAFYNSSISNINFPSKLHTIGESAFAYCTNLTNLNFNRGLVEIGKAAFNECKGLTSVVLTDTIIEVGGSAFYGCTGIHTSYYDGTKEQYDKINFRLDNFWIKELAFTYFYMDQEPTEPGPYWYRNSAKNDAITKWCYTIWYMESAIATVPFDWDFVDPDIGITQENIDKLNSIKHPGGYKFGYWKLNNSVYSMEVGDSFDSDFRLVGDRRKPNSSWFLCGDNLMGRVSGAVLTIRKINNSVSDGAMWDFTTVTDAPWSGYSVNSVSISSGVTYIGSNSFTRFFDQSKTYASFSYIDIPITVTKMHKNAITACNDLLYIYYAGADASEVENLTSLEGIQKALVYSSAENVSDLSTLGEGAYWKTVSSDTNKRIAWTYYDGVLTVGTGGDEDHMLIDFASVEDTPWYSYRADITKVVIRDNVTFIGKNSFTGMESISQIYVPVTLLSTAENAFVGTGYYNTQLEELGAVFVYNDAPTDSQRYGHLIKVANPDAASLFIIPERTRSIAENAFAGCTNITALVITKDLSVEGVKVGGAVATLAELTALEKIYYDGAASTWDRYCGIAKFNEITKASNVYTYSTFEPTTEGKFWKWNDGKTQPVEW